MKIWSHTVCLLLFSSNCSLVRKILIHLVHTLKTLNSEYHTWENFGVGKIGKLWAIRQYFTCQLFVLVILLATKVTKQLPFNSLNVSYNAYYSTSLPAILLAHTDTERFMRSFTKVTPINRIDFCMMNLGV